MRKLLTELSIHLHSLYGDPSGNEHKRVQTLSGLICGMINKNSSSLSEIGSGLPQKTNAHSKEIAAKRFINNKWVAYDDYYLPILKAFLPALIGFQPYWQNRLVLVIDGSQMGKNHAALMISLYWQNRGIPICWMVKKGGKGHFSEQNHIDLVNTAASILQLILPAEMPIVLLGDGEFDGIELQKCCLSNKWDYVFRTANDSVLYENGERFIAKQALPIGDNKLFIPNTDFTEKRFSTNFICWHDQVKYENPIFLVSNLTEVVDIIDFYDQRYSIECLFKDLKSTSFNLHKTRVKNKDAISNLIILGTIAFVMLISLGIRFEHDDIRSKIQRIRKKQKVLSLFTYACRLLVYLINNDIAFSFSFQFSKSESDFSIREP